MMCEAAHISSGIGKLLVAPPPTAVREVHAREGAMPRVNFWSGSLSKVELDHHCHPEGRSKTQAVQCCAVTLALVAALSLSPAMAQGPKASGGNAWPGISQPVEHDAVPAHSANPSFQGARPQGTAQKGFLDLPFDPEAAKIKPHYEWQYHYAGRHAHWEGHRVLVTAPIQSAKAPTIN
jgi:hypothetical protein